MDSNESNPIEETEIFIYKLDKSFKFALVKEEVKAKAIEEVKLC